MIDEIPYAVRHSDRARRVRVRIDANGRVEVVLPRRASQREAASAVHELRPWIERRLEEVQRQRRAVSARGDTLPYLDQTLRLVTEPGRERVLQRGLTLLVPAGEQRVAALERWYRRRARTEVTPRVERACAQLGETHGQISIRGQRTRWGSCSRAGALSFNWRLLLAPESVLDYVIWHEVCHLRALDHSPRFWSLVSAYCPDYAQQVRWLARNGATLIL